MTNTEEKKSEEEIVVKKTCFIITPIGDDNSSTRRHADGIIDECIIPLLEDKYDIAVAHRLSKPGSITNQVIELIYKSDLIIANLTELNPNVMYELAFAHCLKKPVIQIMEDNGQKLPFDITTDRTIFYKNDIQGAYELRKRLEKMIQEVEEIDIDDIDNPIYNYLTQLKIKDSVIKVNDENNNDGNNDALVYIINYLNKINSKINYYNHSSNEDYSSNLYQSRDRSFKYTRVITIKFMTNSDVITDMEEVSFILNNILQNRFALKDLIIKISRTGRINIEFSTNAINEFINIEEIVQVIQNEIPSLKFLESLSSYKKESTNKLNEIY